jgi:hypothetical protein
VPPEQSQRSLQDQLLAAIDELIAAYESAVARDPAATETAAPFQPPAAGAGSAGGDSAGAESAGGESAGAESAGGESAGAASGGAESLATVFAGPFSSIPELRDFERALAEMPGVRDVHVRGYEGADRAIIEVTLGRGSAPQRDSVT